MNSLFKSYGIWALESLFYGFGGLLGALYSPWWAFGLICGGILLKGTWVLWFNRYDKRLLESVMKAVHETLHSHEEDDIRCRLYVRGMVKRKHWFCISWYPLDREPSIKLQHEGVGIIGLCARKKESQLEWVKTEGFKDYEDYLVRVWGFTAEQASRLNQTRKVYFTGILTASQEGNLIGILYVDSKRAEAWNDQMSEKVEKLAPVIANTLLYSLGRM